MDKAYLYPTTYFFHHMPNLKERMEDEAAQSLIISILSARESRLLFFSPLLTIRELGPEQFSTEAASYF